MSLAVIMTITCYCYLCHLMSDIMAEKILIPEIIKIKLNDVQMIMYNKFRWYGHVHRIKEESSLQKSFENETWKKDKGRTGQEWLGKILLKSPWRHILRGIIVLDRENKKELLNTFWGSRKRIGQRNPLPNGNSYVCW